MTSVADWLTQYLIEVCQLSRGIELQQITFATEVGGFLGTLSSGILCDQMFRGRSDICCFFYSLLFIPAIRNLPSTPILTSDPSITLLSPQLTAVLSAAFLGVAINGPKTLSGMALRNMIPTTSFGLGGGLLGVFAQFGVFSSGTGIGWLLHNYQWGQFTNVLLIASILSSMLLLLMVVLTGPFSRKVKAS